MKTSLKVSMDAMNKRTVLMDEEVAPVSSDDKPKKIAALAPYPALVPPRTPVKPAVDPDPQVPVALADLVITTAVRAPFHSRNCQYTDEICLGRMNLFLPKRGLDRTQTREKNYQLSILVSTSFGLGIWIC